MSITEALQSKLEEKVGKELDSVVLASLIQTTTVLSVILAEALMESEISKRAGQRYERKDTRTREYYRHSSNPGSIRVNEEKIPIAVPRLRHRVSREVETPEIYKALHKAEVNESTAKKVLLGISTRNYEEVSKTVGESFGLSRSAISKDMIEASKAAIERFEQRRLDTEEYVGLYIDGKSFSREQIVLAVGVTKGGNKHIIGMTQSPGENSRVIREMLRTILSRGFHYRHGLLCVSDGSKGIAAALESVFGTDCFHQRCRLHKIRNVVDHLRDDMKKKYTRKLTIAYATDSYEEAKALLMVCSEELKGINPSAARSLLEGMEETLTLQKLGINDIFARSFGTTNCIESIHSSVERYTRKVTRWRQGDMRQRWVALALEHIEPRLNKVANYKHIDKLIDAMKKLKKKR